MDLSLHILLDPRLVPVDALPSSVAAMAAGGATVIQLRGKEQTARELLHYGAVLRPLCKDFNLLFIVNDRVDLAMALHADGVHVGQDDMPVCEVRRLAPGLIIGLSAGSHEDVSAAAACPPDYFGMGPVFPTGSKSDAGPAIGLVRLQQWTVLAHQWAPVVAIGGITTSNAAKIWSAGADGIAVISAVAGVKDKQKACAALRSGQKGTGA